MNRNITDTIIYIGANDHDIDLFEGQYRVPNGMAYNSYAIIDTRSLSWTPSTRRRRKNGCRTSNWLCAMLRRIT